MTTPTLDPAAERYLERVRAALSGRPRREIDDILLELRGHIAEQVESTRDVRAALASLGEPAELARAYGDEHVLAQGECARSPLTILHGLMLLGRRSRAGRAEFGAAMLGYVCAFALAGAAGEKLLSPRGVGLWQGPASTVPRLIIDGDPPAGARELLGWWFVPAAAAAFIALLLTTNLLGRWWIRRARRAGA